MSGLKGIKSKIRGIDKTHKVTKAMEAVSAVKMRKSQERALSGRPFAHAALSVLTRLSGSIDALQHSLVAPREGDTLCLVVITSDKGLAGSLNSAVLKEAERCIVGANVEQEAIGIIAIGKKGYEYFEKRGYTILGHTINVDDEVMPEEFKKLTDNVIAHYQNKYDHVVMVYNHFRSTFEQEPISRTILPLTVEEIEKVIVAIVPEQGKYSTVGADAKMELYTVEPDHETVLNTLLPHLLQIMVYHNLLEAKASEHSARMVAMKNASDKARDLSKELTLALNKARQAQITSELSEIVGGIEAMT